MKKILILLLSLPLVLSCDGGSFNNSNPNIPNYPVDLQINMNLPGNSNLLFAGNHNVYYGPGAGARGIVVFNGGSSYMAYDLACPNQAYATCTAPMTISGIEATCSCDNTVYNLYTSQSPGQPYPLKQYRVTVSGNTLFVSN